jgi:hypothetical protein
MMGVTSPPYVLLLIALLQLGLDPLVALRAAGALALVAIVLSLWYLGKASRLGPWPTVLLIIAVMTAGSTIQQSTNGLETGWATAAAIALIAAVMHGSTIPVGLLAGVVPWLRPDLLPMVTVLFLLAMWKQPNRLGITSAAIAATVFLPWAIWLKVDTGSWFPQTMAAKLAFFAQQCAPWTEKVSYGGWAVLQWFSAALPLSLLLLWRPGSVLGGALLMASLTTLSVYVAIFPGGLWHNAHRYVFPIAVPWLALVVSRWLSNPTPIIRVIIAALMTSSLLLWPWKPWRWPADRENVAEFVRTNIPPASVLMVQDAGVFSIRTSNRLVDFVGLKTPVSMAAHMEFTAPSCGVDRGRALASIARTTRAEYVIVTKDWDNVFHLIVGMEQQGLVLDEVRPPTPDPYGYRVYKRVDR